MLFKQSVAQRLPNEALIAIPEELAETISSSDGGVTIYFKKAWEGIFQVIDFYGGSNLGL